MRLSVFAVAMMCVACVASQGMIAAPEPAANGAAQPKRDPTSPMTKILGWGIDHSDSNDLHERAQAIREGRAEPIKVDREVLDVMFPNPLEIMKRDVDALKDSTLPVDQVLTHLTKLEDMVQDIDNANDLYKIDGITVVISRLSDHDPSVVAHAAWVLGTLVQSNEQPQRQVLAGGAMPILLNVVKQGSLIPDATKAKAIYALSTLVRSNPECLAEFERLEGPRVLVDAMRDDKNGLVVKRKAATMMGDIVIDKPSLAEEFGQLGGCDGMLQLLQSTQDSDTHDHVLEALHNLLLHSPLNVQTVLAANGRADLASLKQGVTDVAELEEPGRFDHIFARIADVNDVLDGRVRQTVVDV